MIPSPYTPGSVPSVLVGRRAELDAARADLAVMATYGRFLGRVQVQIGSRGVGKTSLLKAVADAATEAGAVVAWVTARGDESLVSSLVHALDRRLDDIGLAQNHRSALRERMRSLTVEVGGGPAKAGVELDLSPESPAPVGAASAVLGELVTSASLAARERGSAGLCLLVDEIQAAPRADLRTVAYAWQELQAQQPEPAAVMFAAGLPNTPDVLTAAVTFSERFAFRTLHRLQDADARDALEQPAAAHDVAWEADLLERVVDLAEGYPYFLQLYGDALWRAALPEPGARLGLALLEDARALVHEEMTTMFRARWAKATPAERRVLGAMAGLAASRPPGQGDDEPVRRGDVARALGVSTNDLSVARRSLLDKGLVEVAARGTLRFAVPGFGAFVRSETAG